MEPKPVKASEDQLNAILSSMAEGLIAVDKDWRVILMNQAAGILIRTAPQEAIGQRLNQILHFFKAEQAVSFGDLKIDKAMGDKNIMSFGLLDNVALSNRAGKRFPVMMMVAPLLRAGEVSGAIILFRDATKEKQIDQAKSEFVSLASHQLKTPLSAINWYAEMMLEEEIGPLNDKQREYIGSLHESNQRMIDLVNSLLNVSRLDLGTFAVEPEPVDFVAVAKSVLTELKARVEEKKLKVEEKYDPNVPHLSADPKLVRIIFQNLISNAIKYTAAGGRVAVEIGRDGEQVAIKVADTGYGIPAADQEKIFSKFYRAGNVKDKEAEGTGLGLYIVKSIVDSAGGKIWFDSLEGKGTTFQVRLPLSGMIKKGEGKGLV